MVKLPVYFIMCEMRRFELNQFGNRTGRTFVVTRYVADCGGGAYFTDDPECMKLMSLSEAETALNKDMVFSTINPRIMSIFAEEVNKNGH